MSIATKNANRCRYCVFIKNCAAPPVEKLPRRGLFLKGVRQVGPGTSDEKLENGKWGLVKRDDHLKKRLLILKILGPLGT